MARHIRRFFQEEEGQALVLVGVSLVVLLLMAGLGVDVGYLRYQKQQMQKAADAAAIAGAAALNYNGDWLTAAKNDSAANGFPDGTKGITVTINNPPQSGPYTGNTDYIEAIVAQDQGTGFMRIGGFAKVHVRGRAVAFSKGSASGCIYVMDAGGKDTYSVTGRTSVGATCGILVNSTNSASFLDAGAACTWASSIGLVGDVDQDACGTAPKAGIPRFTDPMLGLPEPSGWSCPHTPSVIPSGCTYSAGGGLTCNSGPVTLQHDLYCGGMTFNGGVREVDFGPGTYIIASGGLNTNGNVDLVGSGVTFFITTDRLGRGYSPVRLNPGGDNTRLAAPGNGTYEGILFFQDRSLPTLTLTQSNIIQAGRNGYFEGLLYFPSTSLSYSGGRGIARYTLIDAYNVTMTGNNEFNSHFDDLEHHTSPIHSPLLVE